MQANTEYPEGADFSSAPLPIWELHDALRAAWRNNNRLVVIAPTGSGKTTQVCQMILGDERNHDKQIVVLQPRRVAARSVARHVAAEMGVVLGAQVGYQVRFEDAIGPETRIAFVTEGILLRWLQDDPQLERIGAILFDEFHERNLLSDVGLALVKRLQAQSRPDLLLMVMSATLDSAPVAHYLGDCPILESSGRSYPVDVHYQAWADERPAWELATEQVAHIIEREQVEQPIERGDILIFMPGAYEISRCIEVIRQARLPEPLALIPLHGELSPQDQDRAFLLADYRRVIVSTNVAETSVTLPGIRYVIDSGLARVARYEPERGINTLHMEPISQASAQQRAGRAGRLGPGVCYRLYTQADFDSRPSRNTPEIQRLELSETVLLLHAFGITDVRQINLLDAPSPERVQHAEELLEALGAVSASPHRITPVGRQMLRLPVHPRYARMLVEAEQHDCVREVALFTALVSGHDLLTRINREDKVTQRNRDSLVRHATSDFALLATTFAHAVKHDFNYKACYSYGVNPHVAREVALTYRQMLRLLDLQDAPLRLSDEGIQKCHLVGFIDQLAVRLGGSDEFDLANGRRGTLMHESVVKRNALIVVSEIREITTRQQEKLTLIGIASAVKAEWLRELQPPHLSETVEHVYDRLNKRVVAARVMRYQQLVIGGEPRTQVDPAEAALTLAREFVRNPHPASVPRWERELRPWLLRVAQARTAHPDLHLPAFDDEQITQLLAQAWHSAISYKEAVLLPLLPTFRAALSEEQLGVVE